MNIPEITFSDGTPLFELDQQCPPPKKLGYQIVHMDTGRILPTTNRKQIFTSWAATEKMGEVSYDIPHLDILDYVFKPVYDVDAPADYILVRSLEDGFDED